MLTGRTQARLSLEELHELKHLMGALLALLSFWSIASLDNSSWGLLFLGGIAALLALLFPRWVARIPSRVWSWAGPVLLCMIGVDFLLHLPEFIAPLLRMVVLLVTYRVLAPRNPREDLQLLLLCLFCLVLSGVLTLSLLFAFQILLFTPLAMALLFLVCLVDQGEDTQRQGVMWERFTWPRLLRRVWRVVQLRILLLCSLLFGLVVLVSTLLFILTPRFDFDQAIPFLEMNTQARSGFSEDVQLGEVTEIMEDNRVAMRIDVPSREAVDARPYWRMLVLDEYGNGGFRLSQTLRTRPQRSFEEVLELRPRMAAQSQGERSVWTFYMEGGISRYLAVPGRFTRLRFQKYQDVEVLEDLHIYGLDSVGQSVFFYQIEDLQFDQRFAASQAESLLLSQMQPLVADEPPATYPQTTWALDLPEVAKELLQQINAEITSGAELSASEYSQRASDYLARRFAYSLQADFGDGSLGDPIANWLNGGTRGHCELFAGAFILLARDAGYPARMVVGFAGGSWNSVEDYFVLRNSDAHAWVEIYDSATASWVRVDPTPSGGSGEAGILNFSALSTESGMSAWIDSLRIQWYRRVVNFEQADQIEMAMAASDWFKSFGANLKAGLKQFSSDLKRWLTTPSAAGLPQWLVPLIILLVLAYPFWRVGQIILRDMNKLLGRKKRLDPVRREASRYLRKFEQRGLRGETYDHLKRLRFGPEVTASQSKEIFERAKRNLESKSGLSARK